MTENGATRPSVLASIAMALALTGDALLYAILPLEAATFGVGLTGAGVLLSVNRFVRLAFFGWFASAVRRWGLRRMTVVASVIASLSTLTVAFSSGMLLLSCARILWGIAFGILALTTLGYATSPSHGAGTRIGLSLSIRETGPLFALTAGLALVSWTGARHALALMGALSLLALPIALALPNTTSRGTTTTHPDDRAPFRVSRREAIACTLGFVVDGVFVTTIGLRFATSRGVDDAVAFAMAALAGRRLAILVLAPLAGRLGDRVGGTRALAGALWLSMTAFAALGFGMLPAGAVMLVVAAAIAPAVLPLALIDDGREPLHDLARLNAARDLGAAIGPIVALALFTTLGGPALYASCAVLFGVAAMTTRSPRQADRPSPPSRVSSLGSVGRTPSSTARVGATD